MKKLMFTILIFQLISCTPNKTSIIEYNNPQKALIVVDMQIDYIGENARFPIERSQIDNLITITNSIIDDFNSMNYHIIYMRNVFRENDPKNRFRNYATIEGSSGVEIDPRINIVSQNIFDKYTPDSFTSNDFVNYLIQNEINEVYLLGVMADQCVYQTALGGFYNGYKVNYISNAVGSSSVKNIDNAVKRLRNKGLNIIEY